MASTSQHSNAINVIAYDDPTLPVQFVFDTPTPRPHFISIQKQRQPNVTSTELDALYQLIGRFLLKYPELNTDATFSFHQGAWSQQNTQTWHAHLCVNKQAYLRLAKVAIKPENIPTNAQWINGAKDIETGMNAWYIRERKKYEKYKNDCLAKKKSIVSLKENGIFADFCSSQNQFELVWITPQPRIGVIIKPGMQATLAQLYQYMSEVYNYLENQLRNYAKNMKYFGGHFCLHVQGANDSTVVRRSGRILTGNGIPMISQDLIGYIQIGETDYPKCLPRRFRETWLNAFENAEHFVDT